MNSAVTRCNDSAFALQFGEAVRTEDLGIVVMIAGVAETVGAARTQMNRHARLLRDDDDGGSADALELVRAQAGVWLAFTSGTYSNNRYLLEAAVAWTIRETSKSLRSISRAGHSRTRSTSRTTSRAIAPNTIACSVRPWSSRAPGMHS